MESGSPVVVLRAPLDLSGRGAREFLDGMLPMVHGVDRPRLVIDLSPVARIDSAGVDTLLQCIRLVMRRDGEIKLAAPSQQVSAILELTRTDRLFEIHQSAAAAVRSFSIFMDAVRRPLAA